MRDFLQKVTVKQWLLFLVLVFHAFLLFFTEFTLWPEIVSFPYLTMHGFQWYRDFVHPYPPLLTILLSIFYSLFGFRIIFIKAGAWLLILATDIVIYKVGKLARLNESLLVISLVLYATLQVFLGGNMIWFDTALVLPLVLLVFFILKQNWTWAHISLLTMCLIKQNALLVFMVYTFFLIYNKKWKEIYTLFWTSTILFLLLIIWLYLTESLPAAYFWVYYFPSHFWVEFPGYVQLSLSRHELFTVSLLSIPAVLLVLKKRLYLFSCLYFVLVLAVYPRFSFFHMQPALLLSFVCLMFFIARLSFKNALYSLVFAMLTCVYIVRPYIPSQFAPTTRFFSESDNRLVFEINKIIPSGSVVYFFNLPSQLYGRTKTIPPKPWLDNYGWYFEMPNVESQVIELWSKTPPKYIVWKEKLVGNWYDIGVYEPKKLVAWILDHYEKRFQVDENIWIWKKKN
jgi:hypothetical protein